MIRLVLKSEKVKTVANEMTKRFDESIFR